MVRAMVFGLYWKMMELASRLNRSMPINAPLRVQEEMGNVVMCCQVTLVP